MRAITPLILLSGTLAAQSPQVPHKMHVGDITLTIHDDARRQIQEDVDALTRSPLHFNQKAERARMYFPLIEEVLREERVPEDFKFLVLQESALIPDAVSTSNAVGFWQMKDFTAIEMGLRIDKDVDERMNLISSTHAAAKYLKKNNFYFNNWIYAIQAYQMGAGAVLKTVSTPQNGVKHMDITADTYWYVKRFLAHKVAFEEATSRRSGDALHLASYDPGSSRRVTDLAAELQMDESDFRSYNRWIRSSRVEATAGCPVLIPRAGAPGMAVVATSNAKSETASEQPRAVSAAQTVTSRVTVVNGLPAIRAREGENVAGLAREGGVRTKFFLKCNDLQSTDRVTAGAFYYLDKKKRRGPQPNYISEQGESLWSISQKYGVRLRRLGRYNEVSAGAKGKLPQGTLVWLDAPPANSTSLEDQEVLAVDDDRPFGWSADPQTALEQDRGVAEAGRIVLDRDPEELPAFPIVSEPAPQETSVEEAGAPKAVEHTVRAGETLFSISRQYQVTMRELIEWNSLEDSGRIHQGQILRIEGSGAAATARQETQLIVHQVAAEDTLYSVARRYGVTIKELMEWNDKKNFDLIVGEQLKILRR